MFERWSKFKCCVLSGSTCSTVFSNFLHTISSTYPKTRLSCFFTSMTGFRIITILPVINSTELGKCRGFQCIRSLHAGSVTQSSIDNIIKYSTQWMHLASSTEENAGCWIYLMLKPPPSNLLVSGKQDNKCCPMHQKAATTTHSYRESPWHGQSWMIHSIAFTQQPLLHWHPDNLFYTDIKGWGKLDLLIRYTTDIIKHYRFTLQMFSRLFSEETGNFKYLDMLLRPLYRTLLFILIFVLESEWKTCTPLLVNRTTYSILADCQICQADCPW